MTGTGNTTGKHLSGIDHLRQSIRDILTTPIGTRVMRHNYGSRLFELVDRPFNQALKLEIFAAVAEALERWETRFKLTRTRVESYVDGEITLTLEGRYLPEGREIKLEGLVL